MNLILPREFAISKPPELSYVVPTWIAHRGFGIIQPRRAVIIKPVGPDPAELSYRARVQWKSLWRHYRLRRREKLPFDPIYWTEYLREMTGDPDTAYRLLLVLFEAIREPHQSLSEVQEGPSAP